FKKVVIVYLIRREKRRANPSLQYDHSFKPKYK
ncbi:hypothetical protein TorRG33x02_208810, partial [Trema orientale]